MDRAIRMFHSVYRILGALILGLTSMQIFAQVENKVAQAPLGQSAAKTGLVQNPGISNADYLQITLGLLFVVGLIYAGAWMVKRLNGGVLHNASQMRVLSGVSIGTREKLLLVDVAGTQLLLGVAPGRVNKLHVFDEPVIDTSPKAHSVDFAQKLKKLIDTNSAQHSQDDGEKAAGVK